MRISDWSSDVCSSDLLRVAQKYAVRCGGGHNQRMGLYDAILIKENHIIAAGSIAAAVKAARQLHPKLPLAVAVDNIDELDQALQTGVARIILDNFELAPMVAAVRHTPDERRVGHEGCHKYRSGLVPDQ